MLPNDLDPCSTCDARATCAALTVAPNQPTQKDFTSADGVFVKAIEAADAGTLIPQHSHTYDHTTFVAHGSVVVDAPGINFVTYHAPASIFIRANAKHRFLTLEPNTVLLCIHNTSRTGVVEVREENQLTF
jgi:hypothetical protein